jgi:hypothetical protein
MYKMSLNKDQVEHWQELYLILEKTKERAELIKISNDSSYICINNLEHFDTTCNLCQEIYDSFLFTGIFYTYNDCSIMGEVDSGQSLTYNCNVSLEHMHNCKKMENK